MAKRSFRIANLKIKTSDLTLVAIVPRKKDWEILQREHWYRIPKERVSEIINQVKYLAFYQPKIFEKERWAINYYAEVLGIEEVKRSQLLPDEPNHPNANKDYYKITVSELIKLPKPIKSRHWRRIIFIPTTLQRLFSAEEVNDLYITSPLEEKLYEVLKENKILCERQYFAKGEENTYCLDFALFCREGKLNIECDGESYHSSKSAQTYDRKRDNELTSNGWSILRFSSNQIRKDLKSCLRIIKKTIKSLKGLKKVSLDEKDILSYE